MGYCTQADILERLDEDTLIQLTDDEDAGAVDPAKVDRAIADADAEIDGYVGKRYTLPLAPAPNLLRKLSVEFSIYNLYSRRLGAPESWRTSYEDGRRLLENLAKGLVSLGVNEPNGTPSAQPVEIESQPRAFSRDLLEDF